MISSHAFPPRQTPQPRTEEAATHEEHPGQSDFRLIGPAQAAPFDFAHAVGSVRDLLEAIGEDPQREGLLDTPQRVARAWKELTAGYHQDPKEHLGRVFHEAGAGLVTLRDIPFDSLCEHHMLPFRGRATVAYQPRDGRIVGLSKLARVVEVFSKRLQVQERLTNQIADSIMEHLDPEGVLVIIEAEHFCMCMRGVHKSGVMTQTNAVRGCFAESGINHPALQPLFR